MKAQVWRLDMLRPLGWTPRCLGPSPNPVLFSFYHWMQREAFSETPYPLGAKTHQKEAYLSSVSSLTIHLPMKNKLPAQKKLKVQHCIQYRGKLSQASTWPPGPSISSLFYFPYKDIIWSFPYDLNYSIYGACGGVFYSSLQWVGHRSLWNSNQSVIQSTWAYGSPVCCWGERN